MWVTVTTAAEAVAAQEAGADALVVQGVEAGGHRGSFDERAPGDVGLLALLQLVRAATDLPLVATGGIATGRGIAAVLAAGAAAAQLGTAFMLTPEAATSPAHREALRERGPPPSRARSPAAPPAGSRTASCASTRPTLRTAIRRCTTSTAPVRAAARERGDADGFNLWAGQAHPLAAELPAGELVRRLADEAREALRSARSERLSPPSPRSSAGRSW